MGIPRPAAKQRVVSRHGLEPRMVIKSPAFSPPDSRSRGALGRGDLRMSSRLFIEGLWPELTRTARKCRQRCAVAVAYFGKGASKLLPLLRGSTLVVDASERAVTSGQ